MRCTRSCPGGSRGPESRTVDVSCPGASTGRFVVGESLRPRVRRAGAVVELPAGSGAFNEGFAGCRADCEPVYRPTFNPHGRAPAFTVATTDIEATSTTDMSSDGPLAV